MTKTEIIKKTAQRVGENQKVTELVLNGFMEEIAEALAQGDKVQIPGFGTFSVSERAARTGRNPRTGETIEIAASKIPTFKAGATLKNAVK